MKFTIRAEWTVETKTKEEAEKILYRIEDAAARESCELDDSELTEEDE